MTMEIEFKATNPRSEDGITNISVSSDTNKGNSILTLFVGEHPLELDDDDLDRLLNALQSVREYSVKYCG